MSRVADDDVGERGLVLVVLSELIDTNGGCSRGRNLLTKLMISRTSIITMVRTDRHIVVVVVVVCVGGCV